MIPDQDPLTGLLPPGVHLATWDELVARFGHTDHRRELLDGLLRAARALRDAGCRRLYVDGSFVTTKEHPNDHDNCWDIDGVNPDVLDPVLLDFDDLRAAQKAKFGGELFPASWQADRNGTPFFEFFQRDREGQPKGIIALNLMELQ